MGCVVSCVDRAKMSLFGRHSNSDIDSRSKLERKLYLAKESPEPDFDLSDCQLRQVPPGIYSVCKVFRKERLYLNNNNLRSLEDGGQLSDLYLTKVLNLNCNKFSSLPNDIRYLVNLTELYLQDNSLKNIPESIQFLQCLQILDVSNNRLRNLTALLGKLKNLRKLNISTNKDLTEVCPELAYASNLILIELDGEQFSSPPPDVASRGTSEIMKYLCEKMDVEYCPPPPFDSEVLSVQSPTTVQDPFVRHNTITWEEQEAAIIEQESRIHEASKQQREKFLTKVLEEQLQLDTEIAKVHEAKDVERQRLIKAIQEDEKEIECLVKNFIQSDNLNPEIIQQQLAHEQAEHDRLLEITRQNYDNIRKSDILKAMETLIEENYSMKYSKKNYDDSLNNIKQNMLMQEMEGSEKITELLRSKDQSHTILVEQLLEDQEIQKAVVASLIERVDARSWSLNEEISLISSHLVRLSIIEQEKKKLQVTYNYNELLQQRVQLVSLLDDLLDQQNKRKNQLIQTLKDMENESYDKSADFWLKNYQKLMDSAPKTLLDVGKHLDPVLANYLLQESVIHCLPFLVKFLFSGESLTNVTVEKLGENGVSLSSDRERIIKAIQYYVEAKSKHHNYETETTLEPSAPAEIIGDQNCTGVVSTCETEGSILESECVICMDAECEVVLIPCGHMCCCQSCANQEMESCPMCRSDIERKIKVMIA